MNWRLDWTLDYVILEKLIIKLKHKLVVHCDVHKGGPNHTLLKIKHTTLVYTKLDFFQKKF